MYRYASTNTEIFSEQASTVSAVSPPLLNQDSRIILQNTGLSLQKKEF